MDHPSVGSAGQLTDASGIIRMIGFCRSIGSLRSPHEHSDMGNSFVGGLAKRDPPSFRPTRCQRITALP